MLKRKKLKKVGHIFHWPGSPDFQKRFLRLIALPPGAKGRLLMEEKWMHETFIDGKNEINDTKNIKALLWGISCSRNTNNKYSVSGFAFAFAFPLRQFRLFYLGEDYIDLVAEDYIAESELKSFKPVEVKKVLGIDFGTKETPYPCGQKGHAFLIDSEIKFRTSKKFPKEKIFELFENIPPYVKTNQNAEDITRIRERPIIIIEKVKNSDLDKNGNLKLIKNVSYEAIVSCYQNPSLDTKEILVNNKPLGGTSSPKETIDLGVVGEHISETPIKIEVTENPNLNFEIPLQISVTKPNLLKRLKPLLTLFIMGILVFGVYLLLLHLYPPGTTTYTFGDDLRVLGGFAAALLVMLLKEVKDQFFN